MKQDAALSKLDVSGLSLLALLGLGVGLALGMLRPFFDAILLAGIFAVIMNPIHRKVLVLLGGRSSLAAFITSLLLTILVLIPGVLIVWHFLREASTIFEAFTQWIDSNAFQELIKRPRFMRLITAANRYLAEFKGLTSDPNVQGMQDSQMAAQIVASVARRILDHGSYIVQHSVSLMINFLLMIFAFFFIMRDQEQLRLSIFRFMPFARGHEDDVCNRIVTITRYTLLSVILTAIAQGIATAVGFWIAGLPVLFGAVAAAIASFIPLMSTLFVWLPATTYLVFTGKVGSAIFLSIWWVVVIIFLLDKVLRSILVSGRAAMSTPLVFFFIFGGIHFFGLVGVLYGPLILLALYILFYLYGLIISPPKIQMPEQMPEQRQE